MHAGWLASSDQGPEAVCSTAGKARQRWAVKVGTQCARIMPNNGNYGKTPRPLPMFYYSRTALREPGFLLPYRFT
eukprot:1161882-Pelagomonas_calceolata.AAC.7